VTSKEKDNLSGNGNEVNQKLNQIVTAVCSNEVLKFEIFALFASMLKVKSSKI